MLFLTLKSYRLRKITLCLSLLSIAISVCLFLGIQIIDKEVKNKFSNAISQTDLIIGSRTSDINLLLYSVFHIGSATNSISNQTYQYIEQHPNVQWSIPISLGDGHKGFHVIGTNPNYFKYYRYKEDKKITFQEGNYEDTLFTVTIGATVAEQLNYKLHQKIELSHGMSEHTIFTHEHKQFTITGILKKTYTPVDQALFTSLNSIEAVHADWHEGVPPDEEEELSMEQIQTMNLETKQITALYVGLKSKMDLLFFQREINTFNKEPLMAILPAQSLNILWQQISYAEKALQGIAFFTYLLSLITVFISVYSALQERRREVAILRALGAKKYSILTLYISESFILTFIGSLIGVFFTYLVLFFAHEFISKALNVSLEFYHFMGTTEWLYLLYFNLIGIVVGMVPAYKAYQYSIHDGLSIKI